MSAYIVVDMTPIDPEKLKEYGAAAAPTVAKFKGEFVFKAPIEVLAGSAEHTNKVLIQFPDKSSAQAWYRSDEYQALIPLRNEAMHSHFHLLA
ncbi:DUF1330 domain-containing protein [Agaribacterium sp. ZY112]|uniref:DUF1330 domain-containing protein n=1 Tax=Agaribacterium sp. ZY112 TaxID=3233574 RepID=UPI0035232053